MRIPRHREAHGETTVDRQRRLWDKHASHYDREMGFWEKTLFGDARGWICSQAEGRVLEVAIGTGLNLPLYPGGVAVTGIDLSPAMLEIARVRAEELGVAVELREADAHALPFVDGSFDTAVCTFSLCNIPDERRALAEMHRVLKPGGLLLLADHVASTNRALLAGQRAWEKLTMWMVGDHQTRRPFPLVVDLGFTVTGHVRRKKGIVELVAARK
jgi:ubiquinone/menaquinone biosynthesis C-methylase UbiE